MPNRASTTTSNNTSNNIVTNLARLHESIDQCARRHGRESKDIRLIAVSKTKPIEDVQAAIDAGQKDFSENTIQDALTKIPAFRHENLDWHFIGPLQSNKTKHIPGNFNWWHSLNRLDIARRVSNTAVEKQTHVKVLIQVNIIDDPAKSGVAPDELSPLIEQLLESDLQGIRLHGLMTIGPYGVNEGEIRLCFADLRSLLESSRDRFGMENFDQLSMGMTQDMEQAIAEGATMVRIGSAIFGSR